MLPVKKILCPTDFSDPAGECVEAASELAQHFGAELVVLHVVPVIPTLPPDPNYVFKIPEYEQYLHADAEKQLRQVRNDLPPKSQRTDAADSWCCGRGNRYLRQRKRTQISLS